MTDEITRAWSGMSTRQYKNLKGLKKESLRDNMSTLELVLNMLAEVSTKKSPRLSSRKAYSKTAMWRAVAVRLQVKRGSKLNSRRDGLQLPVRGQQS